MFNIRFYNETGNINFGGGESKSPWRVISADGLAFCGKTFVGARYAGDDGVRTNAVNLNQRTITLNGDIKINEEFSNTYAAALAALESEGVLEINTSAGKRRIGARCCDFNQYDKKGNYLLFTVQFLCDNPYFEDSVRKETQIFKEIPLIDENFTFPGKFSERISRKNILYAGNVRTEPIFYISVNSEKKGEKLLCIENHTSGEKISFNYGALRDETVTVDIENRRIYNSKGENLIKYLTDDSFFDGFHLFPGTNDIEVINRGENSGIDVACSYADRYSEAVYI